MEMLRRFKTLVKHFNSVSKFTGTVSDLQHLEPCEPAPLNLLRDSTASVNNQPCGQSDRSPKTTYGTPMFRVVGQTVSSASPACGRFSFTAFVRERWSGIRDRICETVY